MNRLIALVLCAALPAFAVPADPQEVANTRAWCECVMVGGVCRVENNPAPKGTKVFTSSGPIPAAQWNKFSQDPMMCQRGAEACSKDRDNASCTVFRKMFRSTPMTCVRPGEPVAK